MNFIELLKLLRSCETAEQIDEKRTEIAELIPSVEPMFGFDQKMRRQSDDLWMHSCHTVTRLPKDLSEDRADDLLYFAALIHDIGKPQTQSVDPKNPEYMQYEGHCEKGLEILMNDIVPAINAEEELLSDADIAILRYYIQYHHDLPGRIRKFARKHLKIATYGQFINLMKLQIADCKAQYKCKETEERVALCEYVLKKGESDVTGFFMFSKWMM